MQFTGKNLLLVKEALELALGEVHNQIVTCPDPRQFADALDDLEYKKADLQRLLDRFA